MSLLWKIVLESEEAGRYLFTKLSPIEAVYNECLKKMIMSNREIEKTEEANNDEMKQQMGNFMIRKKGELSLDCWRRSLMLRMKNRIYELAIFRFKDRIAPNKIEFNANVASWI
uniref:Uncharacterized protein n=1 Tax=Acrobeloides nanus TaxID=290746 RepID=A0A914EGK5_9BILA